MEFPQPRLDDLMGQTGDKGVGPIQLKTVGVFRNDAGKDGKVAPTDCLSNGKVGSKFGPHASGEEDVPFGDFTHEELDDDQ